MLTCFVTLNSSQWAYVTMHQERYHKGIVALAIPLPHDLLRQPLHILVAVVPLELPYCVGAQVCRMMLVAVRQESGVALEGGFVIVGAQPLEQRSSSCLRARVGCGCGQSEPTSGGSARETAIIPRGRAILNSIPAGVPVSGFQQLRGHDIKVEDWGSRLSPGSLPSSAVARLALIFFCAIPGRVHLVHARLVFLSGLRIELELKCEGGHTPLRYGQRALDINVSSMFSDRDMGIEGISALLAMIAASTPAPRVRGIGAPFLLSKYSLDCSFSCFPVPVSRRALPVVLMASSYSLLSLGFLTSALLAILSKSCTQRSSSALKPSLCLARYLLGLPSHL
jgi:hypothetical protein